MKVVCEWCCSFVSNKLFLFQLMPYGSEVLFVMNDRMALCVINNVIHYLLFAEISSHICYAPF